MRVYRYSRDLITFVEAKWAPATVAVIGFLVGALVFICILPLHPSLIDTGGGGSAPTLATENDILRQQLDLLSPRLNRLEAQAGQLEERAGDLHRIIKRRAVGRDTLLKFTRAINQSRLQLLMAATKRPRP